MAERLAEDAPREATGRAKKTKHAARSRSSKPQDLRHFRAKTPSRRSADEQSLLADLHGHHKQLTGLLKEFCGGKPVIKPNPIDQRYAAKLLGEMGEILNELRGQLIGEISGGEAGTGD